MQNHLFIQKSCAWGWFSKKLNKFTTVIFIYIFHMLAVHLNFQQSNPFLLIDILFSNLYNIRVYYVCFKYIILSFFESETIRCRVFTSMPIRVKVDKSLLYLLSLCYVNLITYLHVIIFNLRISCCVIFWELLSSGKTNENNRIFRQGKNRKSF